MSKLQSIYVAKHQQLAIALGESPSATYYQKEPGQAASGVTAISSDTNISPSNAGRTFYVSSAYGVTLSLSTPASSADDIAVSNLADGTDGELITWDANGAPTTVAAGTSGQILTSNGAGAAPTFQAAGGSPGRVHLATVSASASSTVDFEGIDSTYDVYIVEFEQVITSSAGILQFRVGTGATPTYQSGASDYLFYGAHQSDQGVEGLVGDVGEAEIQLTLDQNISTAASGRSVGGTVYINSSQDTGTNTQVRANISMNNTTNRNFTMSGLYAATTAITAFRFFCSAGNLTGEFRLYGINNG